MACQGRRKGFELAGWIHMALSILFEKLSLDSGGQTVVVDTPGLVAKWPTPLLQPNSAVRLAHAPLRSLRAMQCGEICAISPRARLPNKPDVGHPRGGRHKLSSTGARRQPSQYYNRRWRPAQQKSDLPLVGPRSDPGPSVDAPVGRSQPEAAGARGSTVGG